MDSLRGHLLIAGPALVDPNFRRAVILIADHNDDGALGVILNRPVPQTVAETVPPLAGLVSAEERIFVGGPVQPQGAVVLAEFEDPDQAPLVAFGRVGFLLGDVEPDDVRGLLRARVFAGYAGWGPGQLEAELEEDGGWITEPALPDEVFTGDPERLWSSVLRRKGREYLLLSTMPLDPSLN